ncbi:MAG: hypothetical protein ABFQ62_05200 [Patescibacteria group bacterium]
MTIERHIRKNEGTSNEQEFISLEEFLKLTRNEIAEIVKTTQKPKNVTFMIDGTRRMLKLNPEHHSDSWLYHQDHIRVLMEKSIEVADCFFDMGVEVVMGPLISLGNLHREGFVPTGLERLLLPLTEERSLGIIKKHQVHVTFYGDIGHAKSLPKGEIVQDFQDNFERINRQVPSPKKRILIGLGFSTDRETTLIAHKAVEFFEREGRLPTQEELVLEYFGFEVPSVDIFIRTNELKSSGGLTPFLTQPNTQLYFPNSPGIISFTEPNVKKILHDYLFNRSLSAGMHQHQPINSDQAQRINDFYHNSQNQITGVGSRVGDIWIHETE